MARRGHCCRCGCVIVDIFRGEQRPTKWDWDEANPLANPPTGLPAVSDGLPFAKKRAILRPWLVGENSYPRGGAMTLDLGATGIAVQGFALPFSQNANATRVGTYVTYPQGSGSFSEAELNQSVSCSLCGESVIGSFAMRIAPLTLMGVADYISLYYGGLSFVELARCVPIGEVFVTTSTNPTEAQIVAGIATRPDVIFIEAERTRAEGLRDSGEITEKQFNDFMAFYRETIAAARQQYISANQVITYSVTENVPGGGILSESEWEIDKYGGGLPPSSPYAQVAARQSEYATYYRAAVARRDETRWAARPAITLGSQIRLIQPTLYRSGHRAAFLDGSTLPGLPSSANSILSAIELRTVQDADVTVATASVIASSAASDVAVGAGLVWPEPLIVPNRSRNPLSGISGTVYRAAIYRDGELVATPTRSRPTTASNWTGPFSELTDEDGSYLIQYDANAGLLQGFLSFVIDRTPPMGAWEQVNDFFIGDPTDAAGVEFDSAGSAGLSRFETEACGWAVGKSYFSKNAGAGSYTLSRSGDYYDDVGNRMPGPPTAVYTIHAVPSGQRYGAQATISLPENVVAGQSDGPIPSLSIAFNKPVKGMRRSMISIVGTKQDGSTVSPQFQIADSQGVFDQPGSTRAGEGDVFTVTLDQESQVHNSSWLVVLSPSGLTVKQPPEITTEPEPCVLKARAAWLIAQDEVGRTLIDTDSSTAGIDRVSSLTTTISASAAEALDSKIDVSGDITIPDSAGKFRLSTSTAIVPQVPETLDSGSDLPFSCFGLSTTIFPSASRSFDANCAAPVVPQKHSSFIVSDSEITSLSFQVSGIESLTQSLTFTSSLGGEPCSQNCWVHQSTGGGASGGFHDTRTPSGGVAKIASYSQGQLQFNGQQASQVKATASARGSVWLFTSAAGIATASRAAATYPALQTTTLGQLTISVSVCVVVLRDTYGDYRNEYGLLVSAPQVWFCHRLGAPKVFQIADILEVPALAALFNTMNQWPTGDRYTIDEKTGVITPTAGFAAATEAYTNARAAYVADYHHVGGIARPWPPTPVILTLDEDGNPSGDDAEDQSVGVLLDQEDSSLVDSYYVTDKDKNWVQASQSFTSSGNASAFNIGVRGQSTAATNTSFGGAPNGVQYASLGYTPFHLVEPFEDYRGRIISGGFFESVPKQREASIVSATLTLTRSQEESLAAGQPVQVQDGNRTWTIQAS